ncbi:MAG: flavodoxin family protein [Clostridiales bacterium]|nr:flavodoxin family protein [Clostridiales bacterium]
MNVLGICSGRINGNTEIMMKEAFQSIERKCGAECKLVRIQEAEIRKCIGCETCMKNHLKGNFEFRCVHKNGSDHYYFIEQLMREADAIIVSSPAYNLLPTGPMISFLNKLHASGDYREVVHANNKVGAAFSIGGTDWTNFTLNVCKMTAMELCGSYEALVDAVHFDFIPSVGAVVLEEDMLTRMRRLGENVADALLTKQKGEKPAYRGTPGVCPDCHGNLLEVRANGVYCPQCLTKAKVSIVDDQLIAEFTEEEMAKNRWSPWGQELHDNNIRKGHAKAADNKEFIAAERKKYAAMDYAVKLPELIRE